MPHIPNLRIPDQDDLLGHEYEIAFNGLFDLLELIISISALLRKGLVSLGKMITTR